MERGRGPQVWPEFNAMWAAGESGKAVHVGANSLAQSKARHGELLAN